MYLPYVYSITNRITCEYYYGSRYGNIKHSRIAEEDIWVYYFTSSKIIRKQIKKYGKESFDIKILMQDEDYNKCYLYEQELISENMNKELCLNEYCRLTGKFSTVGTHHTEKTKLKISKANKGRKWDDASKEAARQRALDSGFGNSPGYNNPMKGKKARPEVIEYRNSHPGGSNTYWCGKKHSAEHNARKSAGSTGKRAVMCEGIIYDSIRSATKAYGYKYDGIIQYRVNKVSYTEYYYVDGVFYSGISPSSIS